MIEKLLLAFLGVLIFTYPTMAYAEPEIVGQFGKWDVYAEKSLMDGEVVKSFCVSRSVNTITSSNINPTLLYIEMNKSDTGFTFSIFSIFPDELPEKATFRTKLDDDQPSDKEWSVFRRMLFYTGNRQTYIEKLYTSSQLILEIKSSGVIIKEAMFDLNDLVYAFVCLLDQFPSLK